MEFIKPKPKLYKEIVIVDNLFTKKYIKSKYCICTKLYFSNYKISKTNVYAKLVLIKLGQKYPNIKNYFSLKYYRLGKSKFHTEIIKNIYIIKLLFMFKIGITVDNSKFRKKDNENLN